MRRVLDVGCASHGWQGGPTGTESLISLAEEYEPDVMIGYDPLLDDDQYEVNGVPTQIISCAAWTYDGTIVFKSNGISSRIEPGWDSTVKCCDFSASLCNYASDELIVKLDIEGGEQEVLEKIIRDGTDTLISELLVEWHPQYGVVPASILPRLSCPVKEWWM